MVVNGVDKGTAIPVTGDGTAATTPSKKLWTWLDKQGIKWIDKQTFESWYSQAMKKDGKISREELKGLLGGRISFFRKLLDPEQITHVVDITSQAWDAYIGNKDGKCDGSDAVTVDQLLENLDETSATGLMQGKDIWGMLESNKIIWVDKKMPAEEAKSYLMDLVSNSIKKNSKITDKDRETQIAQARTNIENGDIDKLFVYFEDADKESADFIKSFKEVFDALKTSDPRIIEDVSKMYALADLNILFGAGRSIKSVYEGERRIFDPGAYDTIAKIRHTTDSLTKKVEDLKARIKIKTEQEKEEQNKTADTMEIDETDDINKLQEALKQNQKLSELSKKFYRFVCMFSKTGGDDYGEFFKEAGYQDQVNANVNKNLTLRDCLHMFMDPKSIEKVLLKAGQKKTPATAGETAVPEK